MEGSRSGLPAERRALRWRCTGRRWWWARARHPRPHLRGQNFHRGVVGDCPHRVEDEASRERRGVIAFLAYVHCRSVRECFRQARGPRAGEASVHIMPPRDRRSSGRRAEAPCPEDSAPGGVHAPRPARRGDRLPFSAVTNPWRDGTRRGGLGTTAPSLHGRYPASPVQWAPPTPGARHAPCLPCVLGSRG
jgi:hypothetical protein